MSRPRSVVTRTFPLLALLLACGSFGALGCSGETSEARARRIQELSRSVTTLQIRDLEVGTGAAASPGRTVSVHYTGTLLDGTEFDSSRPRGQPLEFELGTGAVIPGWDEGIKGMRVGGRRELTIPADMAYARDGRGERIPPHAALKFDVELLDVK
jgi:FKBP-type peptidyl-prolyl cis-trans isomerase